MKKSSTHESEGYIVLITVLILGVAVTIIAAFLLLSGQNASISGINVKTTVEAKAAANGCAQLALGAIQANPTLSTPVNSSTTIDASIPETCTYTISGSPPNYTINATGTVVQNTNSYIHRITVTTSAVSPQITASWQDTP